ncbi:restriction endonuclease subunit S [Arthrobacter sp. ISL-69]|uniref:restriction endonuclease subunit S n=1 Tax=Arthrobacter sp. ISL-69 TaxID=2819113 RepID=UPI001BEC0414|nr:restriction endonuclease subunit S [Arthrobacter sp. ISL-69]MBT2536285.1 restriction endonuclease subunit S [Arthrobacter sp. ISL-69]
MAKHESWRRVPLGQVAEVINGASFDSKLFTPVPAGMPLIRIRDVGRDFTKTYYTGDYGQRHIVHPGDLLVGMDGDFRISSWNGPLALLNQRVCRLSPDARVVHPRWLLHILQGYLDAIWAETSSTTVKHLSSRSIAELPIPVPPLVEQGRILDALEDRLSRLEAADDTLASAQLKLMRLNTAQLRALEMFGFTGVPRFKMSDIARVGSGTTPLRSEAAYWTGGTIPWVTSGDLSQGNIRSVKGAITEKALRETSVKIWRPGTLLVAMYGEGKTRGTVAELQIPATSNQACAAIELREENIELRPWIRAILEARYAQMRSESSGGVQPNLSVGKIKSFEIPVPDAVTRARLLEDLAEVRGATHRLGVSIHQLRHRKKGLAAKLLATAVAGQLVDQIPTEKPASTTLAHVNTNSGALESPTRRVTSRKVPVS